jgi:hypothetical protein
MSRAKHSICRGLTNHSNRAERKGALAGRLAESMAFADYGLRSVGSVVALRWELRQLAGEQ